MGWRQQGHAEGKSPLVASQKTDFASPVQPTGSPMYAWKRATRQDKDDRALTLV